MHSFSFSFSFSFLSLHLLTLTFNMVRPAPESIVPWNAHTRFGKPGTVCTWCLQPLPADCTGWFTQMVPWRSWRPIRYVCQECVDDKSTWNHLCTIDGVYLGVMEVKVNVSMEWLNARNLQFKPLDKMDEPFLTGRRLYRPTIYADPTSVSTDTVAPSTTWIRFTSYKGDTMVCVHVCSDENHSRMDIVPIERLEEWNPQIRVPFKFSFVKDGIDTHLLETLTIQTDKHWWPLIRARLE